jgi:hypothetical protein
MKLNDQNVLRKLKGMCYKNTFLSEKEAEAQLFKFPFSEESLKNETSFVDASEVN